MTKGEKIVAIFTIVAAICTITGITLFAPGTTVGDLVKGFVAPSTDNDFTPTDNSDPITEFDFEVDVSVRPDESTDNTDWRHCIYAQAGDSIEFQIEYRNISNQTQENVMIKNILPNNLQYINGSTMVYNTNHTEGLHIDQDSIVTTGINIGSYAGKSNAYIRFSAKVTDKSLSTGTNMLVNWSQAGVDAVTLQNDASVIVIYG